MTALINDPAPVLTAFDAETGIARITFNRPEVLNAIDLPLARAFRVAVEAVAARSGLRCLVLGGAGRVFMAGGDVRHFQGGIEVCGPYLDALLDEMNAALLGLRNLDAPVLAGVQGVAAGAGLSIALAADLILAAEDARFMLAYDRVGTTPDCGASWFLPRRLGAGRAAQMMMLSRSLTAAEAKDWGLVAEIASAEGFGDAVEALTRRLAAGPGLAHTAFRRLSDAAPNSSFADHLQAERTAFLAMAATADFAEGVSAFLDRRLPRFSGR